MERRKQSVRASSAPWKQPAIAPTPPNGGAGSASSLPEAGPTGVEFCGALMGLVRVLLPRDYPELRLEELQVTLVQGGVALLPGLSAPLQGQAAYKLQKLGAQLRFHTHVQGFDGQTMQCQPGPAILACTLVWAAGVTANPLAATIPAPGGPVDGSSSIPTCACRDTPRSSSSATWPMAAMVNFGLR